MRSLLWLALVVAALAPVLGCEEVLRPGFPHKAHLTTDKCGGDGQPACPTCISCHEGVRFDGDPKPDLASCRACHDQETDEMLASVKSASQGRTAITYSHRTHVERSELKGQCIGCHAGITEDGRNGAVFPKMKACLSCHDDGLQADACKSCHQRTELRQLVPETFLRHDGPFLRHHGVAATRHEGVCEQCHTQNECLRCHEQSQPLGLAAQFANEPQRPLIHRADFVTRHAIEARQRGATCLRCHTVSSCDACHTERGISANRIGSINPHPLGWVGPDTSAPTFHGRAARRDILACASCHEAGPATNCIQCHKVGGHGGNPHPTGWRSLRSPNETMCSYCHVP